MIKWNKLFAFIICTCGLLAVCFGIGVVFNYYFWNFILSAFNTGYQLTWLQAVGVTLILAVIKSIFSKGSKDD